MSQVLQALIAFAALFAVASTGFFVWKTKSADVQAKAVDAWRSLADGYQEKLENRDKDIADMRELHAGVVAELRAQIEQLRGQIEELKKRDQEAVLIALQSHEVGAELRARSIEENAQRRHDEAITHLARIASAIEGGNA